MSGKEYKKRDNLWVHPKSGMIYFVKRVDGKQVQIPTGTTSMCKARKVADKLRAQIWEDKWGFADNKSKKIPFNVLVRQFLEWCKTHHSSYESDKAYCVNLVKYFGEELFIDKITPWQIDGYISHRRKQVKPSTVNHEIGCLKHMLRMAVDEWEMLDKNPATKVKKLRENNQRLRFLTNDERRRLYSACANGPWYLSHIVILAINTGMRRGEILNLKWRDVSIENRIIRVAASKSGRPREIPMNGIVVRMFSSMTRKGDVIFPIDGFRRSWTKAVKTAGVEDLHFHDLRHECASQLVMSGADLKTVQEILGHSSLIMTQRYAHLNDEHKRKAMERLVDVQKNSFKPKSDNVVAFKTSKNLIQI